MSELEARRVAVAEMARELAAATPSAEPWMVVAGHCMAPRIAAGDRVRLERRRVYLPGDVLGFVSANGRLQVHRLLGYRPWRGRWCCVTAADRVGGSDCPIPLEQVLGRVAVRSRDGAGEALRVPFGQRVGAVVRFGGLAVSAVVRRLSRGRIDWSGSGEPRP